MKFLKRTHPVYFGKILELRKAASRWLEYVPLTFPHYTRHTIDHSDELLSQASKLLFADGSPETPVVPISSVEAYVLSAAAYLHDAGMVASDREKSDILRSEEWRDWTTGDGVGAKRFSEIELFRGHATSPDDDARRFVADIQLRYLLSEFIRRTHHERAADVIQEHEYALGGFTFGDPVLRRTISDVCVGHGLPAHELEDAERFPSRRDVCGDPANVRFLAILLRMADLLDMSSDRACPLLLSAACPLPADSYAHWSQYQRVVHRLTAPDRIEITAECLEQEEHRLLHDWCSWLVNEVEAARRTVARFERHSDWVLPVISLDGPDPTVKIRPAPTAKYIPSSWTFVLDRDTVFQRLVVDVYDNPHAYVRELIQNALDATRCQLYSDLRRSGITAPTYPPDASDEWRARYPVRVSLQRKEVTSPLSGESESRQVLAVDDVGIGMDADVIERYLLQVGRSYYTTEEFRRRYGFVPTSRFGVGFLSVFAVSDEVRIDTFKPGREGAEPIRLKLTGPRNYLLREPGVRRVGGTRVEVTLGQPMEAGQLTRLVQAWCRRVEFPILVDDLGATTTVVAETPEVFTYAVPDMTEADATLEVRAFPFKEGDASGEIYVFVRRTPAFETWAWWNWYQYSYPRRSPQASAPPFPASVTCIHGIDVDEGRHWHSSAHGPLAVRIDYRGEATQVGLSRESFRRYRGGSRLGVSDSRVESHIARILTEHLSSSAAAKGADAWKYKQRLVELFPLRQFWSELPEMIRLHGGDKEGLHALTDVRRFPTITVLKYPTDGAQDLPHPTITDADLEEISGDHREEIFADRVVTSVRFLPDAGIAIDWSLGAGPIPTRANGDWLQVADLARETLIGFDGHEVSRYPYHVLLLNSRHPLVQWLLRVVEACTERRFGLRPEQLQRLLELLQDPVRYQGARWDQCRAYLDAWREITGLPPEVRPPVVSVDRGSFTAWPVGRNRLPKT